MKPYWMNPKMNIENMFDIKQVLPIVRRIWALAFWPIVALLIGLYIGAGNSESRIMSDCKYSMIFRVDHQAFTCQRKI